MALVPSSSLWSSIKIPFCLYGKRKIAPTIPYVDPCKDFNQRNYSEEAEPAREMISLKVPTPEEENPVPHLRPLSITLKKRTHRKSKTKQIGYVIVPGGDSLDSSNDWEEICGSSRSSSFDKAILNPERSTSPRLGEDLNWDWSNFDWERVSGECDCVPSVKPWMQEQHRKHRKTQKVTEDRKREANEKEKVVINCKDDTSGSTSSKGLKTFQGPHDKHSKELQKPTAKVKEATTYAKRYERKLAELYSIELGIKI